MYYLLTKQNKVVASSRDNIILSLIDGRHKGDTIMELLTLQNIKDQYYADLALGQTERRGFETYLRDEYTQVYDANLQFIGYEKV